MTTEAQENTSLLAQFIERTTRTGADAGAPGDLFVRKELTLRIPRSCAPSFGEDFKLTLRELTSRDEAEAAKHASEQIGMAYQLTMRSLYRINGAPIESLMRETVWEGLGTMGRQLVTGAYATHFAPDSDALLEALQKKE